MDSLRIGICDDEAEDLSQVMEMVSRYDESKQLHIASFLHASDLLLAFKQSPFDIVILDIEMEPPTGFDIAKVLVSLESPPVVIFATKSNAYALKGYGVAIRLSAKNQFVSRSSLKPWTQLSPMRLRIGLPSNSTRCLYLSIYTMSNTLNHSVTTLSYIHRRINIVSEAP